MGQLKSYHYIFTEGISTTEVKYLYFAPQHGLVIWMPFYGGEEYIADLYPTVPYHNTSYKV